MSEMVMEAGVSGESVNQFLTRIEPVVRHTHPHVVQAGILTILLRIVGPDDITEDEMLAGVSQLSAYLALYGSSIRQEKVRES